MASPHRSAHCEHWEGTGVPKKALGRHTYWEPRIGNELKPKSMIKIEFCLGQTRGVLPKVHVYTKNFWSDNGNFSADRGVGKPPTTLSQFQLAIHASPKTIHCQKTTQSAERIHLSFGIDFNVSTLFCLAFWRLRSRRESVWEKGKHVRNAFSTVRYKTKDSEFFHCIFINTETKEWVKGKGKSVCCL